MMSIIDAALETALKHMIGQTCWHIGRNGIGANLLVKFGRPVCDIPPRIFPKTGEVLTTGEYAFIIFCSWRIATADKVVCTWLDALLEDDEQEPEELLNIFKQIEGCTVVKNSIALPSGDLQIVFSNNMVLSVFCDISVQRTEEPCYYFSTMDTLFSVESGGVISMERIEQQYYP